jgi:hypothetical protein
MNRTIAGSAVALFALVAMATAPQAAATPEEDFLSALTRSGFSYSAAVAPQVVQTGHSVCSGWASGNTYADAVATIAKTTGGSQGIAGVFVRAATTSFCPKYASNLP